MVAIPHLGHNRDLLVLVIDLGDRAVQLLERLVEQIHILDNPLKQQCLPLFLLLAAYTYVGILDRRRHGPTVAGRVARRAEVCT